MKTIRDIVLAMEKEARRYFEKTHIAHPSPGDIAEYVIRKIEEEGGELNLTPKDKAQVHSIVRRKKVSRRK